jgi:phospholipid transport system substrate-binding protein
MVGVGWHAAYSARAATESEAFIQQTIERAYAILNDASLNDEQRDHEFDGLLRSVADIQRLALFTLGPYARAASKAELDAFVTAFEDYVVVVYQDHLNRYREKEIKVTGSTERAPGDVIVNAEVADAQGPTGPIKLAFRVRKDSNGNNIVTDLQFDGVWLAIMEREDFSSFVRQHKDNVGLLSEELARRAAQRRAPKRS